LTGKTVSTKATLAAAIPVGVGVGIGIDFLVHARPLPADIEDPFIDSDTDPDTNGS